MSERLLLTVPTYAGHQVGSPSMEYAEPNACLIAYEDRGVRIVLGSHDPDDPMPDVQIERRPNGWAIFLHPLGGSDPCAHVYFHDDGRSWLLKNKPVLRSDLSRWMLSRPRSTPDRQVLLLVGAEPLAPIGDCSSHLCRRLPMSDHIAAYIRVGGTIPKRLVEPLCLAITQEDASLDWGEGHFSPNSIDDLLANRRSVDHAQVLTLYDDNARWGEFADLEKFLIEHRVPFDRHHEAKFDVNARLTQFRPDSGRHDFNTTVEGHVVVPLRDVHYLRDDLEQVRDRLKRGDCQGGLQRLQAALESLARRVRDPAPPLPSLEISD